MRWKCFDARLIPKVYKYEFMIKLCRIGATDNFSFYDIDIGVLECIDTRIIGNDGWKVERVRFVWISNIWCYKQRTLKTEHIKFNDFLMIDNRKYFLVNGTYRI